jgi:nucleoside-diphosphate-sugar epimerase|tara:strand:+ start:8103 stop:9101 length:999 start_codon:yes stop_codon:yes gene_type:complete
MQQKTKDNKIFITGGAGYVGAVLTPYLINKGYKVTVLDLMIYGENVLQKNPNLKIIKGDIRDTKMLKRELPGHDILIHLACISNDPSFELNPELGKSINLDAFSPLVNISKKNGINRFIYASSSSVYGIKDEPNVNERMSLEPLTDYSKFKADCETILLKNKSNNFIPIVIRPATVCGYSPRQRLDVVVNILTNLAYHKKEISVFGGEQLRPNIHIMDMVRAYDYLINASSNSVSGQIFNAGYENQTVNHLASLVKKVIGPDVKIKYLKSDDNRSYHISSKKIKDVLGFETKKTIEDAIKDLKNAFDTKKLEDTLTNEKYFNIKRMNNLKLK